MAKLYKCTNNASCALGTQGEHGLFTGGTTPEMHTMLTGTPPENLKEGKDYGEGFCPSCGQKGEPTGEDHESLKGDDPHAAKHAEVAARVEDPEDELTTEDAQAAFLSLVAGGVK
jgi:hypothetical protein